MLYQSSDEIMVTLKGCDNAELFFVYSNLIDLENMDTIEGETYWWFVKESFYKQIESVVENHIENKVGHVRDCAECYKILYADYHDV